MTSEFCTMSSNAPLVTTDGLGHRKILRDPAVVERVVDFVSARDRLGRTA